MDLFNLVGKVTVDTTDAIDKLYGISTIVSGLIGGAKQFAKDVITTGSGFDYQMSAVQAVLGKTEGTQENMNKLRAFGLEVAKDSIFTAEETATAYYYMGMAGWKTEKMIAGLPGIIALAAASGEDLSTTSDIVTDSLTAFGYGADQATRFADVLAAAATNSNTDVARMGATFKYVAPAAGSLGYSIEDVAISIGLMASAGIKGTQAGTGLRNIFTRIATNAGETKNQIGALTVVEDELGVAFYDSNKRARPWLDVLTDMRKSWNEIDPDKQRQVAEAFGMVGTEGMTAEESMSAFGESLDEWESSWAGASRTAEYAEFMKGMEPTLNELGIATRNYNGDLLDFSEIAKSARKNVANLSDEDKMFYANRVASLRALPGFLAMMQATDEEFEQIRDSIYNSEGSAQWAANTRLDNLLGDVKKFNSALDVLKIAIFDDIKGPLRDVVQFGTGALNRIRIAFEKGSFEEGIKQLGTEIETFVTEYGPMFEQLGTTIAPLITTFLNTVAPAFSSLAITIGDSIGGGIIAGIAGALQNSNDPTIRALATMIPQMLLHDVENPGKGGLWGDTAKSFLSSIFGFEMGNVTPLAELATDTLTTVGTVFQEAITGNLASAQEFAESVETEYGHPVTHEKDENGLTKYSFADGTSLAEVIQEEPISFDRKSAYARRGGRSNTVSPDEPATIGGGSGRHALEGKAILEEEAYLEVAGVKVTAEQIQEGLDAGASGGLVTIGGENGEIQVSEDIAQSLLEELATAGSQASSQISTDIGTSIETGGAGGASGMANAITSAGAGAASSVGNAIQAAISGRSYSINVSANVTGLPRNTTTEKHAKSMATGSILRGATVFGMNAEGQLMSGGESGAEAVVGVNSLNRMIQNSVNNAMLTKNTSSKSLSNTMRDSVAAGMSDYSTSFIDQLVARLSEVINAAVASIASRPNVVYMNGKSAAKQMADYNAIASSSRNRSIATGYGVAGLHKNTVNLMR